MREKTRSTHFWCSMAILYIAEFKELGTAGSGHKVSAPKWNAITQTAVDYSGGEQSHTLSGSCHFVRLHTDDVCHINIGSSGTPAATTSMARMAADQTEFAAVPPGGRIRVIAG